MRAILVDWIIEVHTALKLQPETQFLTVSLIDRYLEHTQTTRNQLQLVGISAMLIASKFEEIYPPRLAQYEAITREFCTQE